ncbi:uncharacterized protein LOC126900793 [Daktulosphaira vitifoliae]|uniref:uncharacterized protein LOC126900793 n=1 Tax=Daktulosphaira vitifoliae TaxID=58002 RepID=UPI0021AAA2C5|nr:uncharacterized protein LOC126900793 [Daktulosphaira vitifoliae]
MAHIMNAVFCFSCRLFPNPKNKTSFTDGFNNWKNLSEQLSWRIDSGKTLDSELQKEIRTENDRCRTVPKRIIVRIIYLAQQNDAFRGKNYTIYTESNGKFLKLIEMKTSFDNPMAKYLRNIKNKIIHQHYLGPRIQTELLHLIGINMVGHKQGVQARILNENPRALFLLCCAHSLNILLGDIVNCIPRAITFFRVIQRLNTLFSASTECWEILEKHLKCLTLEQLSDTRWECQLESVKAVKVQLKEINEALIEVSESTSIPAI